MTVSCQYCPWTTDAPTSRLEAIAALKQHSLERHYGINAGNWAIPEFAESSDES